MAPKKSRDLMFETFIGELVQLVCRTSVKRVEQTEDMVKEMNDPVIFEGYLLDMDGMYFYIGDTSTAVCSAVKKAEVTSVHIVQMNQVFDDLLDQMEDPEDDKDIN